MVFENVAKKRTCVLVILLILLLGICGVFFIFRNAICEFINKSQKNISDEIYVETITKIQDLVGSEEFNNSNRDIREKLIKETLETLERQGLILKNSIVLNEEAGQFFYEFVGGGEGSVFLESFSSTEISVCSNDRKYEVFDETIFETIKSEGYIYEKSNLSAVIIEGLGEGHNEAKEFLNNSAESWTANKMVTDLKHDVTAEEMKTALLSYDFIEIVLHGVYEKNGNTGMLVESASFGDTFWKDIIINPFSKYHDDIKNGRIGIGSYENNGICYYLTSKFISYYYENKLDEKIIWLGTCHGYENDILVKSFSDCGAKAVIGATETVTDIYESLMADAFVNRLLFGYSVKDSLNSAKYYWGKNDSIFQKEHQPKIEKKDNTPAEFRCYGSGEKEYLQYLTFDGTGIISGMVVDELENPVENARVVAIPNKGNTYEGITDSDGKFIINNCPIDSYRIESIADGYELYQSEEFLSTSYVTLEGDDVKPIKIKLKKIQKGHTESDLKEKVLAESGGNIGAWVYEDFDGNGTKEAYAVITGNHDSITECDHLEDIYFISGNGEITKMPGDFWGGLYYSREKEYEYIVCQGKGFFAVDSGNGGSGWQTLLYSVKDELPYELDISRTIQGFNKRDGIYYTTENEFLKEGGHKYTEVELIYNSSTQQFSKGNRIISEEDNKISDWKSAYIEVLSNLNYSSARFITAYIDEDDIPELIVAYDSSHVAGCEIYTYYNRKVSKLEGNSTNGEFGSSGEILYLPHKNLFDSRYYGMGSNSDGLYRINNGNAQLECDLQNNDYFTTVRVIGFKIDGIERNENEYWDKYNSYEIDSMVSANYDDMIEVNSTNISNYFN